MATDLELASAANRRPIGNAKVAPKPWAGFEGVALAGPRTSLEPVDADRDAADIFRAATEGKDTDRIFDYMNVGPFSSAAQVHALLVERQASQDPVFVVYRDNDTGRLGGMGSFMEIRPAVGVAEIGHIWFGRDWQRDTRATEVLTLKMRHALETLAYRRLEWKCDALNTASRAAALRLGFRYEGIFLNHMIVKGRSRDTAWFSLTQEEWPAVREAHDRWLAPDNFDAQGKQKCSLSDLTRALW
ncbi:MAG: GNAT family N-acetyltransferase [Nitrospinae bacterium]|nr:GNAT family N-acetyltransferase [Nitrospinota bacterium]